MNLYPLSMKLYQLGMISPCIKGASVTGYCIDPFYVLGCRIDLQKKTLEKKGGWSLNFVFEQTSV